LEEGIHQNRKKMHQIRNASLSVVRKKNAMDKESGMHQMGQGKV
jgi:hypothetical protein